MLVTITLPVDAESGDIRGVSYRYIRSFLDKIKTKENKDVKSMKLLFLYLYFSNCVRGNLHFYQLDIFIVFWFISFITFQ